MKKRLISLMVTMVMMLSFIPVSTQAEPIPLSGLGMEADPFLISNLDDLVWVVANNATSISFFGLPGNVGFFGKFFKQTANIDISSIDSWIPIGDETTDFQGTYDGNGYTISGLKYNGDAGNIGLFGSTLLAKIKNLGVINVNINSSGDYVGGLVGLDYGTITNCYSTGSVNGSNSVGGLVGHSKMNGSITNSYFTGTVSGGAFVGGLVGFNNNISTITNSYSTGAVSGSGDIIGGLIGCNKGEITNSYSTGSVNGSESVGGLVGFNSFGKITNSYSTGAVNGNKTIGGLVGNNAGKITNSYATGVVSGSSDGIGGLAGFNYRGAITNSYAIGAVSGADSVGGLVGWNGQAAITNCYATGTVSGGGENVGGLVGFNSTMEAFTNCYYVDSHGANGIGYNDNSYGKPSRTQQAAISFYKTLSSYSNSSNWNSAYPWDFTGIWAIDTTGGINNGYPYLLTNMPQAVVKPISVMLNDKAISFDQPPIIENDRVLVPLRAIFEAMGATIAWDEATLTVTAIVGDITIKLQIGNKIADKNGQKISLDVPAMIVNDRTLVPIRFIAESMGAKVDWDEASKSVIITK